MRGGKGAAWRRLVPAAMDPTVLAREGAGGGSPARDELRAASCGSQQGMRARTLPQPQVQSAGGAWLECGVHLGRVLPTLLAAY